MVGKERGEEEKEEKEESETLYCPGVISGYSNNCLELFFNKKAATTVAVTHVHDNNLF